MSLEVKKFAEAATKPAVEEFTKLTERINSAASKLSQFRKETEGRKKSVQIQEAGDQVEKADAEVKKLAEAIEPLTNEDADTLSGEAAEEACAKLVAAVKAAQNTTDGARNFLLARQRDAK